MTTIVIKLVGDSWEAEERICISLVHNRSFTGDLARILKKLEIDGFGGWCFYKTALKPPHAVRPTYPIKLNSNPQKEKLQAGDFLYVKRAGMDQQEYDQEMWQLFLRWRKEMKRPYPENTSAEFKAWDNFVEFGLFTEYIEPLNDELKHCLGEVGIGERKEWTAMMQRFDLEDPRKIELRRAIERGSIETAAEEGAVRLFWEAEEMDVRCTLKDTDLRGRILVQELLKEMARQEALRLQKEEEERQAQLEREREEAEAEALRKEEERKQKELERKMRLSGNVVSASAMKELKEDILSHVKDAIAEHQRQLEFMTKNARDEIMTELNKEKSLTSLEVSKLQETMTTMFKAQNGLNMDVLRIKKHEGEELDLLRFMAAEHAEQKSLEEAETEGFLLEQEREVFEALQEENKLLQQLLGREEAARGEKLRSTGTKVATGIAGVVSQVTRLIGTREIPEHVDVEKPPLRVIALTPAARARGAAAGETSGVTAEEGSDTQQSVPITAEELEVHRLVRCFFEKFDPERAPFASPVVERYRRHANMCQLSDDLVHSYGVECSEQRSVLLPYLEAYAPHLATFVDVVMAVYDGREAEFGAAVAELDIGRRAWEQHTDEASGTTYFTHKALQWSQWLAPSTMSR